MLREGHALARAAEGNLGARVPSCPDWDVAELVWHTGQVHRFFRTIVERQLADPDDVERLPKPDDLLGWFREGVDLTAAVLAAADPSMPVWTWSSQKDAGFVRRRMAQETAVHRVDAQDAAGTPRKIEHELAVDGIDEFFSFFIQPDTPRPALGGSVHMHCTDAPGEWVVGDGEAGEVVVTRGHAKADVALRAPASDLLLALWRRRDPDALEVRGDRDLAERFLARPDLS